MTKSPENFIFCAVPVAFFDGIDLNKLVCRIGLGTIDLAVESGTAYWKETKAKRYYLFVNFTDLKSNFWKIHH